MFLDLGCAVKLHPLSILPLKLHKEQNQAFVANDQINLADIVFCSFIAMKSFAKMPSGQLSTGEKLPLFFSLSSL